MLYFYYLFIFEKYKKDDVKVESAAVYYQSDIPLDQLYSLFYLLFFHWDQNNNKDQISLANKILSKNLRQQSIIYFYA
jgi:hypothetical protein